MKNISTCQRCLHALRNKFLYPSHWKFGYWNWCCWRPILFKVRAQAPFCPLEIAVELTHKNSYTRSPGSLKWLLWDLDLDLSDLLKKIYANKGCFCDIASEKSGPWDRVECGAKGFFGERKFLLDNLVPVPDWNHHNDPWQSTPIMLFK